MELEEGSTNKLEGRKQEEEEIHSLLSPSLHLPGAVPDDSWTRALPKPEDTRATRASRLHLGSRKNPRSSFRVPAGSEDQRPVQ